MTSGLRVLIVGGYGFFGSQLVRLLAHESRATLIIAGRSLQRAQALCQSSGPTQAKLTPAQFDRDGDLAAQLQSLSPALVIDASGPFQDYVGDPYRLARAAIAQGADYLDLADATGFVDGIKALDGDALAGGRFVVSGVSSFPVLTAALVRHLSHDLERVDTITAGIAPSPWADVGINVLRAISSYAGKPVALVRDGRPANGIAFVDTQRFTIAPPGRVPLDPLHFSLVDVPDHTVLPPLWPRLQSIWVGAGPVPSVLHRCLNGLAQLVHWRLLPSLSPLAQLFHAVMRRARWGPHRGGMFVAISGAAAGGTTQRREWHLVAEGDAGPLIPSMAAAAVIRNLLDGKRPAAGARASTGDIELADYEALFVGRTIYTGLRNPGTEPAGAPLYHRILASAWDELAAPIRAMHNLASSGAAMTAVGQASIERGANPLAHVVASLMAFPKAGRNVPVQVEFTAREAGEVWQRTFGGKTFSSSQRRGSGRWDGLLAERFGPMTFGLAVVVAGGCLQLVVRKWSMFGVPMPQFLAPGGHAREHAENERFNFDVEITLPLIGRIVRYRGYLEPVTAERPRPALPQKP